MTVDVGRCACMSKSDKLENSMPCSQQTA